MTPEQIQLVQASFAKIAPIARPVAALFYQRLFNLDPTVEALFNRHASHLEQVPSELNLDSHDLRKGRVLGGDSIFWGCAMPKSCSSDLRERVLDAVEEGATRREAAERFDVSASSAVRWFQVWQKEGRRAPRPCGGSQSPLEDHAEQILALVAAQPDWTLDEFVAAMGKRRLAGSRSALWRFLERHGISVKKKPAGSRARPGGRGPGSAALDPAAGPA